MKRRKVVILTTVFIGTVLTVFLGRMRTETAEDEINNAKRKNIEVRREKPGDSVDLLVLGDSESYTSVSPMQLWTEQGITSYVCGQPGQKIQDTYRMFCTALKLQSPKIVLLETNLMFRQPGPVANVMSIKMKASKDPAAYFRYTTFWDTVNKGKKRGEHCYKGFVLRGGISISDTSNYMKPDKQVQKIPPAVLGYMGEIQTICRQKGIVLVLWSAPSPKNYNYKKHNALKKYASAKSLPYVDLNLAGKELNMDWKKDSYDKGDHLNLNGARKVTTWLGKYLKKNYDLADHRGEPGYRAWDEELEKYRDSVEEFIF